MTEVPSPQLRISDQERESALSALGDHMTAGRIDIDEYGERSARITAAKTRGELGELFADLPQPHPAYGAAAAAAAPPADPAPAPRPEPSTAVAAPRGWSGGQRLAASIVPLAWLVAIVLISTDVVAPWPMIALPIAFTIFGRALWGHGSDHDHRDRDDRRMDHREHRLDHRDRRREMRDEFRRQRRFDR
ncbi:MAG TPA: DUF1707 domain-containing protein [Amycolatopsis sp.]